MLNMAASAPDPARRVRGEPLRKC